MAVPDRMTSAEFQRRFRAGFSEAVIAAAPAAKGRSHFKATATVCERGHKHPSKVEARVCATVHMIASTLTGTGRVYRNVRLPLWALPPTDTGIPMYATIDFGVTVSGVLTYLIDAKSGSKRSPEWARGKAAVEATYGIKVEERSS